MYDREGLIDKMQQKNPVAEMSAKTCRVWKMLRGESYQLVKD